MTTRIMRLLGLCILVSLSVVLGPLAQAAERVTWYHHDLQGSPVAATDRNGAVVWRERYKPYGQRMLKEDGGSNKLWYTGKAHEEGTRLSYFGARWYHPEIGRFMSVDPVDFTEDNVQSFNRYAYANNNPYRYVDPDGRLGTSVHALQRGMSLGNAAWVGGAGNAALYAGGSAAAAVGSVAVPDPSDLAVGAALATSSKVGGVVTKSVPNGKAFPDRALPRDKHGNPVPETNAPHTQLGTKSGRNGSYPQAREFDANGKPVRDIDFTNHGRADHPNPHQHQYQPNATGGTLKRGPTEPLQYP